MERNGKRLADLGDGHPRRLADARNAWRKMSAAQRAAFLEWLSAGNPDADTAEELAETWEEPKR